MSIFLIIFFLILTAFFAGAEIAYVTANKLAVEVKKSKGSSIGKILSRFYENPEDYISVILIGINISIVVLSYLLTDFFNLPLKNLGLSDNATILISTFLVTIIILVFGEFLPKAFFRLYANNAMNFLAYPLLFFHKLLYLPAKFFSKTSNFIIKYLFRESITKTRMRFSPLDLEQYMHNPMNQVHEEIDADIFKNALNLNQIRVSECMIPRTEIVFIDVNDSMEDLKDAFINSKLSKIIIVDQDIDNILGYIHHQQLFHPSTSLKDMVRDIPFVPETLRVDDLMLRMNKLRISVACVVDEYGGTSGLITLEDILEEIFGEIEDEHDDEAFLEMKVGENEYLFSGRLELSYLNDEYGLNLPLDGDYHTLSGYLVSASGTIPEQGSEIILGDYKFVYELVSDTKIESVRIFEINA
ncbi:MAG TPA: hemolysin family protein [Saprospiraceae bacterium]|nr:HlyC/CorC family transporter [Saprospiraceae bacterium]HOJ89552.1 hemolysin family protein [Saprospiraceae bacterium]HUN16087.1 hemolysin family protein [Saprospiraceae bacterium]